MPKVETITQAQAVAQITHGKAGVRVRFAMELLTTLEEDRALTVVPAADESAASYKAAFKIAADAVGIPVRLRLVGDVLYVMHGTPEDADGPSEAEDVAQDGADEALRRTRAVLDQAIEGGAEAEDPGPAKRGCILHPEAPGHEHGPDGACLVGEPSEAAGSLTDGQPD